jgi:hypothetical protein
MANSAGGLTSLTVRQENGCSGDWYNVIANRTDGGTFGGCWKLANDGNIIVAWQDGDLRQYPASKVQWSDWVTQKAAPAAPVPQKHLTPSDHDTQS